MTGRVSRFLTRKLVPGPELVGVGGGVLLGLAVSEVAGAAISAGWLLVVGVVVVADRFARGHLRTVVGLLGAIGLVQRFLNGHWCEDFEVPSSLSGPVIGLAVIGWVAATILSVTRPGPGLGVHSILLLFGFAKLLAFLASPAGLPVVALLPMPTLGLAIVVTTAVAVWAGLDPASAEEAIGWVLGLSLLLIAARLAVTPLDACASEAAWSVAAGITGGFSSLLIGRFARAL